MKLRKSAKQLVDEASGKVRTLTVAEARSELGKPDVLFVDLRDVRELEREGRVPGALHAPRGMLEFWVDPESPYYKPVFGEGKQLVLYCQSGWRSALAAATLVDMGVPNVAHIATGYRGWKDAGGATEPYARKGKRAA